MVSQGLIFDIQSFSVHDGPGCRTTVFMNGCPLRCRWCSNPESWLLKPHIMFSERSCQYNKSCTACHKACPKGGLSFDSDNKPLLNRRLCKTCTTFDCATACYHNALKICAKHYDADQLMDILKRDSFNWGGNGGVTFSGGEPFTQNRFLLEMLKRCKERGIHTAVETTGYVKEDLFLPAMDYIDFAFIDMKHMDREKHKEKTGVYNDLILKNVSQLAKSTWQGRLILRMPTIHGFNDNDENIQALINFMQANDLVEINLLPFHRMGESKWTQLGKDYDYAQDGDITDPRLTEIQNTFLENDIACYIGHDTLF